MSQQFLSRYYLHQNHFKEFFMVTRVERQSAAHHLVHDDPDPPPVHSPAVVIVLEDLGCQVLGGSTEGLGCLPPLDVLLAEAEVCYLDMTVLVEEKVLKLQISVYYPSLV